LRGAVPVTSLSGGVVVEGAQRRRIMARPLWTGAISFGLVNVPVKMFTAVRQKEVHFHMLHEKDGARIQQRRVCSLEDKEVPYEEVVKGYEIHKGEYVAVTKQELAKLDPEASKTIDIEDFVSLGEIDPAFYEHTYYLVPDKAGKKAYGLLLHAMETAGKVGIARMVMRSKQYLAAVRPMEGVLALSTMLYADELVPRDELEDLPKTAEKPKPQELKLAEQLIESLSRKFEPERYKDDHREKVLELLEQKAAGKELVFEEPEAPKKRVVNLMDALMQSLQDGEERKGAVRHRRAQAARTVRKRAKPHRKTRSGRAKGS
jgi:DNA end-binding protein Ku